MRSAPRNDEHAAAVAFMVWWAYWARRNGIDERLLFAIPNGGKRHAVVAIKLKEEGVRPGVSDYFFAVPKHPHAGLWIELKKGGPGVEPGRATKDQLEFGRLMMERGYAFKVAVGALAAEDAVAEYMGMKA